MEPIFKIVQRLRYMDYNLTRSLCAVQSTEWLQ